MKMLFLKIKRKLNRHLRGNEYVATHDTIEIARNMGVKIGEHCRIYSMNFSTEPFLISIGDHVTVTDNVQFITHDGAVWVFRKKHPDLDFFGKIKIGNNVFIGLNSIILPGTEVGDNIIIAAGSVLKGEYASNSVIGGVPAKKICSIDEYFSKNSSKFVALKGVAQNEREQMIKQLLK